MTMSVLIVTDIRTIVSDILSHSQRSVILDTTLSLAVRQLWEWYHLIYMDVEATI